MDFIPNCRYGHGDLIKLTEDGIEDYAFIIPKLFDTGFSGNLYVCPQCGYTEFFDSDPALTAKRNKAWIERLSSGGF